MLTVVISVVAFAFVSALWLLWVWRRGFPEHRRARAVALFECQLPATVAAQRLGALAQTVRGWRVESWAPGLVRIRAGATLYSWRKRIVVTISATSSVTCTVEIDSSSPQLYDWGDNRRAVTTLSASLTDAIWPSRP